MSFQLASLHCGLGALSHSRNSISFHKNVIFNAVFCQTSQKLNILFETQAFHAQNGNLLTKIEIDSSQNSRKNSSYLPNQKLELLGIGPIGPGITKVSFMHLSSIVVIGEDFRSECSKNALDSCPEDA